MKIQANNSAIAKIFSDSMKNVGSASTTSKGNDEGLFKLDIPDSVEKVVLGSRIPQIDSQINSVQENISLNQTAQSVLSLAREKLVANPEEAREILKNAEFNSENVFKKLGIDVESLNFPEDMVSLEKSVSENISEEFSILSKLNVTRENVIASSVSIQDFKNAKQMLQSLSGFSDSIGNLSSNLNSEAASSLLKLDL